MGKQNSVNLDITNNPDGFDISGGSTTRKLTVTGGDITLGGSGSALITFPSNDTVLAGLGITQSFSVIQSFTKGITTSSLWVGGDGATFNSTATFSGVGRFNVGITAVGGTFGSIYTAGAGANSIGIYNAGTLVMGTNGRGIQGQAPNGALSINATLPGALTPNQPTITLTDADGDLGGSGRIDIDPSVLNLGNGTVHIGNTTNGEASGFVDLYGRTEVWGRLSAPRGVSAHSLLVTAGVTFSSTSTHTGLGIFNAGITTQSLFVAAGSTFNNRSTFTVGLSAGDLQVSRGATFSDITNSMTMRNYGEVFAHEVRKELGTSKTATIYHIDLNKGNTFYLNLVGGNAGIVGSYATQQNLPSIRVPADCIGLIQTTAGVTGATFASASLGTPVVGQFMFNAGLTDTGVTCAAYNSGNGAISLSKPATRTTGLISAGVVDSVCVFVNPKSEGLGMVASPFAGTSSTKSPARVMTFTMLINCTAGSSITWNSGLTSYGRILWPSGTAPTLTTTNGKMDVFSFLSYDYGVTWLAFNAGQNF